MKVDAIVVGAGLAGVQVHYHLMKMGKKAIVFNESNNKLNSSEVALGMANPITGRNLVKSWMAEELFPYAKSIYQELENLLEIKFLEDKDILKIFSSQKESNQWVMRSEDFGYSNYLSNPEVNYHEALKAPCGYGRIKNGFWVDTLALLNAYKAFLMARNELYEHVFNYDKLEFDNENIRYQNYSARYVVFCEGYKIADNPFFNFLPVTSNKGEILEFNMDLPIKEVLNKNGNTIPLSNGVFRTGATFDRNYETDNPTKEGREELESRIVNITSMNFNVLNHYAGIRPTVPDRRPLVGSHPEIKQLLILNGLGTKGVTLSPYMAEALCNHMFEKITVPPAANVSRYYHLYKK